MGRGNQMTLGELISTLKKKDQSQLVTFDFVHFRPNLTSIGSYRGYYSDLAIGYKSSIDPTVAELVKKLEEANGAFFHGYKGGAYLMLDDTLVWVANPSETGGTGIVDVVDGGWRVILKTEMIDP